MNYKIIFTDTADALIKNIVLYIAENFGDDVALQKLGILEESINMLRDNPFIGIEPGYNVLRRQSYRVLVLKKDLVFYKVNEEKREVTVHAVVDQRQDYISIIQGL